MLDALSKKLLCCSVNIEVIYWTNFTNPSVLCLLGEGRRRGGDLIELPCLGEKGEVLRRDYDVFATDYGLREEIMTF